MPDFLQHYLQDWHNAWARWLFGNPKAASWCGAVKFVIQEHVQKKVLRGVLDMIDLELLACEHAPHLVESSTRIIRTKVAKVLEKREARDDE